MKRLLLILFVISSINTFAQEDELPFFSLYRLSGGISINGGAFSLEGNEGGHELMAADLNRHENNTKSKSVGVGYTFNYTIFKQMDLVYNYALEYSNETLVDAYWIKSKNLG